jgi:quinol monooxygenase YgiN
VIDFIATWQAKPGSADELTRILREVVSETRQFQGCERVEVYRPDQAENTLILIERWLSPDAYASYQDWRAGTGVKETLRGLMASPPVVQQLTVVDA